MLKQGKFGKFYTFGEKSDLHASCSSGSVRCQVHYASIGNRLSTEHRKKVTVQCAVQENVHTSCLPSPSTKKKQKQNF